jgi:hypothetical protein
MATTPETMSQPMDRDQMAGGMTASPVDDQTYDVLMALASKLEAIDTYRKYGKDGGGELWQQLANDDRKHAEMLLSELKRRLV